jgi:hypothetical protein
MEKLPLRPLFFVPAYLLVFVATSFSTAPGVEVSIFWSSLFGLGLFALHFFWTYRALAFAFERRRFMGRGAGVSDPLHTARRFILIVILILGISPFYQVYLKPALFSGAPFDEPLEFLLALAGLYFSFGIFWIAARTLCEAELGGKASTIGIIGTFFQFLTVVIGAPFIYRRLKNLREQPSGGIAETA